MPPGLPDFSDLGTFLLAILVVFAVVEFRYFLVSGIFFLVFFTGDPARKKFKKIDRRPYPAGQFRREIWRSTLSSFVFGISGALLAWMWQQGYARIYWNAGDHHWLWMPASLLIALFAQETYYYWLHRWMHIPAVFRVVHRWHHDSRIASPWTAFSFHPLEAVIQALFLPLILLVLPMQVWVLITLLVIMTISSVVNHLDWEIYPHWFGRNPLTRALIGATHHALHHKQYRYNYGLYFTWWDKWLKTESPSYEETFRENAGGSADVNGHGTP